MVKRQTVWLSAMMVFSLMLIGYYTLGTPPAKNTATTGAGTQGATVVEGGSGQTSTVPASTSGSGSAKAVTTTAHNAATGTAQTQPSDWFLQYSMNQASAQGKLIHTLEAAISDPRASSTEVSQAYRELTTLQTQQENANRVHDLLLGAGYPDSLVVFEPHNQVHVYVEASSLTPLQAVKAINLVAQTLGVQSNLVTVSSHS